MEAWYNIWVAGVDVFTTCIQRGMTGGVYELGMWPPFALAASYLAVSLQYLKRIFKVWAFFPSDIAAFWPARLMALSKLT